MLLTLQEHDGALDRLLHRHKTLPERDALRAARGRRSPRSTAEIATTRAERDEIAREEQQLDDEARSLAREGDRGRGQDVLG